MVITSEQESIDFLKKNSTEEQFQKLSLYQSLLLEDNQHTNLISRNTVNEIFYRHILDSFQLLQYIDPKKTVLDIGTGAGFPGLVLAIMGIQTSMIDSNNKKVKFVRKIIDVLGMEAQIYHKRIEDCNIRTDILTARALQPLGSIFNVIQDKIIFKDKILLLKGRNLETEISEAQKIWDFQFSLLPSITSSESNIIEIIKLEHIT